jgi:hypothetical protein
MPRRFSGSAAVPEHLLDDHRVLSWCRNLLRSLDKRQGLHGVSKSGAEALRRESGLAAVGRSPSVADPLPDYYRRSHDEGTSRGRLPRRSVRVVAGRTA